MGHDDEFDEFDVPPEQINKVIDKGDPVEFGDYDEVTSSGVVIELSTIRKVGKTAALGHEKSGDVAAATG